MAIYNEGTTNKLLINLYKNPKAAEDAYNFLIDKGYNKDDITVVMSEDTRNRYFPGVDIPEDSLGTKAIEGMGVGGTIGGTIGAIAAAIAAAGTVLAIPALGLVMAGPIAAGLAGAGAGGLIGTLAGALVGKGFPDDRSKEYEEEVKAGAILVGAQVPYEQYDELEKAIHIYNDETV